MNNSSTATERQQRGSVQISYKQMEMEPTAMDMAGLMEAARRHQMNTTARLPEGGAYNYGKCGNCSG